MIRYAFQRVRGFLIAGSVLLSMFLVVPAASGAIDGAFGDISSFKVVGKTGPVGGGRIGFSMNNVALNVGDEGIPWGFPVLETEENPWVVENDNNGSEGNSNHPHDGTPHPFNARTVGTHPHFAWYLYRQDTPTSNVRQIGSSDLKHAYRSVIDSTNLDHHVFAPGVIDAYNFGHNRDQSWYGPIGEMNPDDFSVATHEHMASYNCFTNSQSVEECGYHRDHGKDPFSGAVLPDGTDLPADPGHPDAPGVTCLPFDCNIDHLLQADLVELLPEAGVRWFVAGTFFVMNDIDFSNNSRWMEIFPSASIYNGDTLLNYTTGESGSDLSAIGGIEAVPLPAAIWMFISGLAGLSLMRRRQ